MNRRKFASLYVRVKIFGLRRRVNLNKAKAIVSGCFKEAWNSNISNLKLRGFRVLPSRMTANTGPLNGPCPRNVCELNVSVL